MILLVLIFLRICCCSCELWDRIEFDFIIVGAGTAGSVLASRLSEDSDHQVLLLEAGGEPQHYNDIPYFASGPFNGKLDWAFPLNPGDESCTAFKSNDCVFRQGKGLGGSTLINGMVYARGNKKDFEHWKNLGNQGWGYDSVLPFFKKMENYRVNVSVDNEQYHGVGGPVDITPSPYYPELTDAFLEAGREIGYKDVDHNGKEQKGFSQGFFNLRNGLRFSAYKAYLEKARQRQNLRILTNALVHKVEFDDEKRAVGVVFEYKGKERRARAKKEVIISAGAINSPKILQLSGIGSKKLLGELKIPLIYESRGVGENLQNHIYIPGLYILLKDNIGFDLSKDLTAENFEKLETQGEGPLTVPLQLITTSFVDSEYANKSIDWPDLEIVVAQPRRKLNHPWANTPHSFKNYVNVRPYIMRPKSTGCVKITSSKPHDSPLIKFNYLSEIDDVKVLVSGIKIARQLGTTKAVEKLGAFVPAMPVIEPCKNFNISSDDYMECYVRNSYLSTHHVTGTCKMGVKNDIYAVVDEKLRVYGVRNLRVIDNSVAPTGITGHTMAIAFMIGEKGADMVIQHWRNKILKG